MNIIGKEFETKSGNWKLTPIRFDEKQGRYVVRVHDISKTVAHLMAKDEADILEKCGHL